MFLHCGNSHLATADRRNDPYLIASFDEDILFSFCRNINIVQVDRDGTSLEYFGSHAIVADLQRGEELRNWKRRWKLL